MNRRQVALGGLAWVCSGVARGQKSKASVLRSPHVLRLSQDVAGQTVNLRDYCAANGRQNDSQNYQELIELGPATIIYPEGAALVIDRPIQLRSDQTHRFAPASRIDAEIAGYALTGVGKTSQSLGKLKNHIHRYGKTIELDAHPEINSGDVVLLADVSDPRNIKLDVNIVQSVKDKYLETRYEIGRSFQPSDTVKIYHVYSTIKNVNLIGQVLCENHHPNGGWLSLTNAASVQIRGMTIENAGYIGLSLESSLGIRLGDIVVKGAGGSGIGVRASKNIALNGFAARNVRADESLTLYDNVSYFDAQNVHIEQYRDEGGRKNNKAGNDILVDYLCSRISFKDVTCRGSATYNMMINNQSDYCSIDQFELSQSNLGGIRVSGHCRGTKIGAGSISDVTDMIDQEARKPVSAISVGSTCSDIDISEQISFSRIRSGVRVASFEEA